MVWSYHVCQVGVARVIKCVNISLFSAKALLQNFDQIWRARGVLCKCNNLKTSWNRNLHRQYFVLIIFSLGGLGLSFGVVVCVSLADGLGVVLHSGFGRVTSWWFGGLSMVGFSSLVTFYVVVWRAWSAPPPLEVGMLSWSLVHLVWACWPSISTHAPSNG